MDMGVTQGKDAPHTLDAILITGRPMNTITRRIALPLLVAVVLWGCGDSGTDPEGYNQIGGSYAGVLVGTSQGVDLTADFTVTINQSGGDLSGSYGLSGQLSDGFDVVNIQGTGPIDGTIQSGDNPSVNFTITPGVCPNQTARFSGSYDTTNRRLTVAGPVEIFDGNCDVFLTYNATIIMTR